jgi:GNAT superfamily N-acetyltransferase
VTRAWVAAPREAAAVAGLMAGFRDHLGAAEPSGAALLASVQRIMAEPDGEFLLAGDGPSAVLQLRFRWSLWKDAPDAWVEDLFVRADARRAGLGDARVRLAIERATARGARRIELDCFEDNAPALALYERNGFSTHSKGAARSLLLGRGL